MSKERKEQGENATRADEDVTIANLPDKQLGAVEGDDQVKGGRLALDGIKGESKDTGHKTTLFSS